VEEAVAAAVVDAATAEAVNEAVNEVVQEAEAEAEAVQKGAVKVEIRNEAAAAAKAEADTQAPAELAETAMTPLVKEAAARAETGAEKKDEGCAEKANGDTTASGDSSLVTRQGAIAGQAKGLDSALARVWARIVAFVTLFLSSLVPWVSPSQEAVQTVAEELAEKEVGEMDQAETVEGRSTEKRREGDGEAGSGGP
jgi:hypothetical protein